MDKSQANCQASVDGGDSYSSQNYSSGLRLRKKLLELESSSVNESNHNKNISQNNVRNRNQSRQKTGNSLHSQVCMPFLAGMCAKDVGCCKRRHPSKEEAERLTSKFRQISCRYGKHCRTKGCLYSHPSKEIHSKIVKQKCNNVTPEKPDGSDNHKMINITCKKSNYLIPNPNKSWSEVVASPKDNPEFSTEPPKNSFLTTSFVKEETNSLTTTASTSNSMELDQDTTVKSPHRFYEKLDFVSNSSTSIPTFVRNDKVSSEILDKTDQYRDIFSKNINELDDTSESIYFKEFAVDNYMNSYTYVSKTKKDDIISAADEMELLLPLNVNAKEFVPRSPF